MKISKAFSAITTVFTLASVITSSASFATGWKKFDVNDPIWFNVNYKNANWHPAIYNYDFSQMPLSGSVDNNHIPWSDSYWPSQRGAMAYRWKQFQDENMDQGIQKDDDADAARRMSLFFGAHSPSRDEVRNMTRDQLANLSPLEKYSIYMGDYKYKLLEKYSNSIEANKAYWEGYCHDWTPVSLHYSEPMPVDVRNPDGVVIPFGSADVKAIMISAYQDRFKITPGRVFGAIFGRKDIVVAYVGNQSSVRFQYPKLKVKKGVEMFGDEESDTSGVSLADYHTVLEKFQKDALRLNFTPDGGPLPSDPNFVQKVLTSMNAPESTAFGSIPTQDVNAGAFHVIVSNQLGLRHEGFGIDKTPDVEVWNQPAFKFESTLLGYEGVKATSAPGTVRTAHIKTKLYYADDTDYGWAFWNPTLLNLFQPTDAQSKGLMDSFMSEFNRYSKLLMNEGDITEPETYPNGIIDAAHYEYTVDLDANNKIIGGDWISFDHPDRLWIQKKADFSGDYAGLTSIQRGNSAPLYQAVSLPTDQTPNYGHDDDAAAGTN